MSNEEFTDSCSPVTLPCDVGEYFVNPCNCTSYFECHQKYEPPLLRHCAPGTAWDDSGSDFPICNTEAEVYYRGICSQDEPWARCERITNISESEINVLKDECLGSTVPGGGDVIEPSNQSAAIVGGVLGGLIFLAIIILILMYLKFIRKVPSLRCVGSKRAVDNPVYSEAYDTIDIHAVTSSTNKNIEKPPVPRISIETLAADQLQPTLDTTYDNSKVLKRSSSPILPPRSAGMTSSNRPVGIQRNQIPSEYSRVCYLEPGQPSLDEQNGGTDRNLEVQPTWNYSLPSTRMPDYIDFGHYNTDYSLAMTAKERY